VGVQLRELYEVFVTDCAVKGSFAGMYPRVHLQFARLRELLVADRADKFAVCCLNTRLFTTVVGSDLVTCVNA